MKVETTRFGALEVDDGSLVNMTSGPFGFERLTRFCLIRHRPDTNFRWLQSIEDASLAFVVVDPADHFDTYEIEVTDAEAEALQIQSEKDALALVVVTVSGDGKNVTANLAAPILLNAKTMTGMQVVLPDDGYDIRHELMDRTAKRSGSTTVTNAA